MKYNVKWKSQKRQRKMRIEMQKLVSIRKFLNIKQFTKNQMVITLEKPSIILLQNIYHSWLMSIQSKTVQHFPVYLTKSRAQKSYEEKNYLYGYIDPPSTNIKEILIDRSNDEYRPKNSVHLNLNLVVPQTDIMQYFIQWQRYRKYWWSSITTTPSLLSINDMKHGDEGTDVNIVANFKSGTHIVETISIKANNLDIITKNTSTKTSTLTSTMGLETALLTIVVDGLTNSTKEGYLRLHNRMAPYKFSFALESEDETMLSTLNELAQLTYHKLSLMELSAWLPDFTLPLQFQIKENLQMGVPYTAILNEDTLKNGIFHLLNSSTMLKEQVHVADFDSYAALLCGKH